MTFSVVPDEVFNHVMGKIQRCLDADSDYEFSEDESDGSVI